MKKFIFLFLVACSFTALAQKGEDRDMPISLALVLDEAQPEQLVHLYLKGDPTEIQALMQEVGGTYKRQFKAYAAVAVPADRVMEVNNHPSVEYLHFEHHQGQPLLSKSRDHTRTNLVHIGQGNVYGSYAGDGVIMGIIDAGLDLDHPDFHYPNGNTRVIELWDQNLGFDLQKTPQWGYGQVWDSAEINAGLCPHEDQSTWFGHGTNTTGIAAAWNWKDTNNESFNGHAPGTELIIVSSDFNSFNWTQTVADAVQYIFERAEALGRPCVINASLGTYVGSHDGRDLPAQEIEALITEEQGRLMVCAAGNGAEEDPFHMGYEANSDTAFTWFDPAVNGNLFFEAYGDLGDFERLQFSIGADQVENGFAFRGNIPFDSISNRLNVNLEDTLWSTSGHYLARVQTWADSLNGTYRLQFYISNIDSTEYNYRLMCTGSGRIDIWSAPWIGYAEMVHNNLPSVNVFPDIANYMQPDDLQSIVSSWACNDKVITVGNYVNQVNYTDVDGQIVNFSGLTEGAIAASSSSGPSRTGLLKPEIAAPGDLTLTAGAAFQIASQLSIPSQRERVGVDTLHNRAGGTSSASPVVAGIGAMFFEKCANSNWLDFKQALANTGVEDQLTGQLPNNRWGNGKADAVSILQQTNLNPTVSADQTEFCLGDEAQLNVQGNFTSILWTTGDTLAQVSVNQSALYYAEVTDDRGCFGHSDTIAIFARPNPVAPTLVLEGNNPTCPDEAVTVSVPNEYGAYEWSSNLFTQSIQASEAGMYYCIVSNIHGCLASSDTLLLNVHPETSLPELTIDQAGVLHANVDSSGLQTWRWYVADERLQDESDSVLQVTQPGSYQVAYVDSNGCVRFSDPLNVFNVGIETYASSSVVFPNPFNAAITIENSAGIQHIRLLDATGRIIISEGLSSKNQHTLPTTSLPSGVYMLEITTSERTELMKLIK